MQDLLELSQPGALDERLGELYETAQPVLEELTRELGYERAFVALVDLDAGRIDGTVGIDPPEDLLNAFGATPDEPGPIVRSLRTGRPVRVDDALRDPRIADSLRSAYARGGLIAFAVVPLPPASAVLVVGRNEPINETAVNELLPYAARLVASAAARGEAKRLHEHGEAHASEKEWLWWMLNTVQDPVVLTDEQNTILLYNVHAERLLIARPEDSPGRRRAIEINNVLLSAALSSFALDQGSSLSRDLSLVDPVEGNELLFEVLCQSATNLHTGEQGLVSVLKDVTDLRGAAEELRRAMEVLEQAGEEARVERDRLNLILAGVADPIVVTEPAGQLILMNEPAGRLLQPASSTAGHVATVYVSNDAKLTSFLSQLSLEAAQTLRGELQLSDPETGETLTMHASATEVRNELGQVTAIVTVFHDLTKLRELERRTLEQQLFESEKLAALGRLAAETAHEINNPLEAIKNALYLLVSRISPDDPNHDFAAIAQRETERVSNIMRQMLGFYRSPAREWTDVNRTLSDALLLFERPLRQAQVQVVQELDVNLPSVRASADQLKQVFLNLLLNARDAMPRGGTLHVTSRSTHPAGFDFVGGQWVFVQFQDTGIGISEQDLRHIFEPFFSTKREQRGTGLGLWVSLGIVQQHGGQMKVRSRPGHGTTFTIALPIGSDGEEA